MSTPADMREPTGPLMWARRLPVVSPSAASWKPAGSFPQAGTNYRRTRREQTEIATWWKHPPGTKT